MGHVRKTLPDKLAADLTVLTRSTIRYLELNDRALVYDLCHHHAQFTEQRDEEIQMFRLLIDLASLVKLLLTNISNEKCGFVFQTIELLNFAKRFQLSLILKSLLQDRQNQISVSSTLPQFDEVSLD